MLSKIERLVKWVLPMENKGDDLLMDKQLKYKAEDIRPWNPVYLKPDLEKLIGDGKTPEEIVRLDIRTIDKIWFLLCILNDLHGMQALIVFTDGLMANAGYYHSRCPNREEVNGKYKEVQNQYKLLGVSCSYITGLCRLIDTISVLRFHSIQMEEKNSSIDQVRESMYHYIIDHLLVKIEFNIRFK